MAAGQTFDGSALAGSEVTRRKTKTPRGRSVGAQEQRQSRQPVSETAQRPPDRPIHVQQDSLFSSTSGYTNYRGFLNLAVMLLVLSNARVALENIIKYGILIRPSAISNLLLHEPHENPNLVLLLILNGYIMFSLWLEIQLSRQRFTNRTGAILHTINISAVLLSPPVTIVLRNPHPVPTTFTMMIYVCAALKLISYAHVNFWCRRALYNPAELASPLKAGKRPFLMAATAKTTVKYPDNLTVSNMYYFMCAPTLCYELNFPRSPCIRWWFVTRRCIEIIGIGAFIAAALQQWIEPLIKNSIEPLVNMEMGRMTERLLKLAVPNHALWLLFFYMLFHSMLNLQAELLTFADREFYRDWWNSETLQYFWSNWNMPVHRWAARHVYKPLLRHGVSPFVGAIVVFLISAALHEYLVSVPLQMFRLWAFMGMLAQIPLSFITKNVLRGGKAGNVVVWLSLILGQPLAILMYFHDWYVINHQQMSSPTEAPLAAQFKIRSD